MKKLTALLLALTLHIRLRQRRDTGYTGRTGYIRNLAGPGANAPGGPDRSIGARPGACA